MSLYFFLQLSQEMPCKPDDVLQWLLWDSTKGQTSGRGESSFADLGTILAGRKSINLLIAPGEDVRSIKVNLPNKSRAAYNTIPYQLEENVSSQLEDLHIVSGKAHNTSVTSLVVEHSRMQQWQQFINQSPLKFRWLIPDFALLPSTENLGSAWSDGKRIIVKSAAFEGALNELIFQRCKQTFWPTLSEQLTLYATDDALPLCTQAATHNQSDLLSLLAENFVVPSLNTRINLLRGDYQQTSNSSQALKPFIGSAIVAVLIILSLVALGVSHNLQLAKQDQQLVQKVRSLYQSLYPKDRRITDPVAQMRGHLKRDNNAGGEYFLAWMAAIAPLLNQQSISLVNLKYDTDPAVLRLQLAAKDYNSLENLSANINQLANLDLSAQLGTLQKSSLDKTVTSILTLRSK